MLLSLMDGVVGLQVETTMFHQILELLSSKTVPDNLLTMEETDSQHQMHGAMDQDSPIPTQVRVNGGQFNSDKITGSTE